MNIHKEGYTPKNAGKPAPKKPENFTPAGKANIRSNVGFIFICSSIRSDGSIVNLGYSPELDQFVTWVYDRDSGFNYVHYTENLADAFDDFERRVADV